MNNDITYNGCNTTLANTFHSEWDTNWARNHNHALYSIMTSAAIHTETADYLPYLVLSLLNDIVHHDSCKRALYLNISDCLAVIHARLENDYFADEVIQDCKRALDVWHAHSPNRSIPGVNGPVTSECIAARSDLADYALQLLNYEMGRIDCGTVDSIVRASVGQ
tara:strand:- start:268 stop:762 length:495 start_codon:yes stop_codon:yes gene_type:complete